MIGFIIAVVAGFLVPQLDGTLARPVARIIRPAIEVEESEIRLLSYMLALLIAGVIANLLNSGSAFWIILGTVLGYFGPRIVAAVRDQIDRRSSS